MAERLNWRGNQVAQAMADQAYRRLKPKARKSRSAKRAAKINGKRLRKRHRVELKLIARDDYRQYLKTPHWRKKRSEALKFYGRSCRICRLKRGLHVHHRHYRSLGCEEMTDLDVLCSGCHRNLHEGSAEGCYDPLTTEFLERFSVR